MLVEYFKLNRNSALTLEREREVAGCASGERNMMGTMC
jgi:hypothetical protein